MECTSLCQFGTAIIPAVPYLWSFQHSGRSGFFIVTNPTVYNRSICKYNLIDVYKYNLIDACVNVFLESLERKFMLAILIHGNLV